MISQTRKNQRFLVSQKSMISVIFKAYDVRGIYNENLTEEIAYNIGKAFVSFLKCKEVIVGYDMRESSLSLVKAFTEGANEQGADAVDIGLVSTDGLYFASGLLKKPGVMFTASHNPAQYAGIKFCRESAIPINYDTGLKDIKEIIENSQYKKISIDKGKTENKNILNEYVSHVRKFVDIEKLSELKIAVDAGNGMAGKVIPLVYDNLPIEVVPLYFELDGSFPNHPADPSKFENLKDLQKEVKEKNCDFGMAFDGDADRIFFIDDKGNVCNSSLISSLIIKNILRKNPNEKIIHNVVCSKIVKDTIKKFSGEAVIERVGHSYIKDKMRLTNSIFACEHSAHYYFRDNFNADSGIITSLIICDIVSKENKKLSQLLEEFKVYHTIEETNVKVEDKDKKIEEIELKYKDKAKSVSKLDGITIEFEDWWFNVRPSNTEPLLRLNLEANSKSLMNEKKEEIVKIMEN